jgi:VCBS repeat-containing protein
VLANDTDADGDSLTAVLVAGPSHGTLTLNADGSYSYKPDADYHGPDSFTYKANDGTADSGSNAKVSIDVTAVDDPPTAVDDAATVAQDARATTIDALANDSDVDGGTKTIAATTHARHGTVATTNAGADLTYTPNPGYCNTRPRDTPDTFSYTLNGGSQATVSITVTCAARLAIGHPTTTVTPRGTEIRLTCLRARCAGTLTLKPTNFNTPLQPAKANPPTRFDLAAGTTRTLRVQIPAASRARLAARHTAVVRATAHLTRGPTTTRLITLTTR